MRQITGLTSGAKQAMTLVLADGGIVPIVFEYVDGQQGWFMSIQYPSLPNGALNTQRLVVSANMLRKYRTIIPFGIGCMTLDGYEPIFINDFANGRASLFLLDSIDVANFEEILSVN